MKTLPINLKTFGFVNREKNSSGEIVKFRCGRDFLYYSLSYYCPEKFNPYKNSSLRLEKSHSLGFSLPWWLMWTQLQFIYLPKFISKLNLELSINYKAINTFFDLFTAIALPRKSNVDEEIKKIKNAVDVGYACGIDVSLGLSGLLDHILFVYGYDGNNFYIFDTHKVPGLEYEKITEDDRFIMKLPKNIVRKRWSRFGRVWIVKKKK